MSQTVTIQTPDGAVAVPVLVTIVDNAATFRLEHAQVNVTSHSLQNAIELLQESLFEGQWRLRTLVQLCDMQGELALWIEHGEFGQTPDGRIMFNALGQAVENSICQPDDRHCVYWIERDVSVDEIITLEADVWRVGYVAMKAYLDQHVAKENARASQV